MERKFLVLLRHFILLKEQSYFNIFVCFFLRPHGETRRFLSAFSGSSRIRLHFAPPRIGRSHSLTMPARCLLRVHYVASSGSVVALKKRIVPNESFTSKTCYVILI